MRKPIFWHQGLFLQPQHLQLHDLYNQSLLFPYNKYLQPHLWGVGNLSIQKSALANFHFQIDAGEFWFPDMTYAALAQNASIEPRSFDASWIEGGKPLIVYVGLKKISFFNENVTVLPQLDNMADVTTRFVTVDNPEDVVDLHHGGPPAQVKNLSILLKIFFHNEIGQLDNYELIPIAQIERSGDDVFLSENFVPPCFTIAGSAELIKLIKEINYQVTSRSHELESYKKQKGIHTAEFGARDMVYLLALRTLNRYIPLLNHFIESQVHPWTVYSVLRQLIGELSTFTEKVNVMGESEDGRKLLGKFYDHRNLGKSFTEAANLITQLMDEITAGPEYVVPLQHQDMFYTAQLKPEYFEGANRFYLAVKTQSDPSIILGTIERAVKISSRGVISNLITYALPGEKIEYLTQPPQELPKRADSIYFQVNHNGEHWAGIKKEKNIAVYWDSAPSDLKIELMITRGK